MKNKDRIHIIYRFNGWAVKKEDSVRASKILSTREKAIKFAKDNCVNGTEIIVHNKDGSVWEWMTLQNEN